MRPFFSFFLFFYPLKLVTSFANVTNFNIRFVILISNLTIPLNLFVKVILSITSHIYYYYYLCHLFISFHLKFSLLVEISLPSVLYLYRNLHTHTLPRFIFSVFLFFYALCFLPNLEFRFTLLKDNWVILLWFNDFV